MASTTTNVKTEISEAEKVYNNKKEVFSNILGEDFVGLERLARSNVHVTEIEYLLSLGCPPELLTKFLL